MEVIIFRYDFEDTEKFFKCLIVVYTVNHWHIYQYEKLQVKPYMLLSN